MWDYRNSSPKNECSVIIYSPPSSSKPVWMSLFCWTQWKIFWRKFVIRLFWGTIDFHSRKKYYVQWCQWYPNGALFPTLFRISEQRHSYRFGTTWWWVNDNRILIFGRTIPLRRPVLWYLMLLFTKSLLCNYCLLNIGYYKKIKKTLKSWGGGGFWGLCPHQCRKKTWLGLACQWSITSTSITVVIAAPFESKWWRFTANQETDFTDEMCMIIKFN